MKIILGTDHAGFEMKNALKGFLEELGYVVEDKGAYELDPKDDYPDYISKVAEEVAKNPDNTRGIIFGGSGQGEAIDANRFPGVRAALFYGGNQEIVILSRKHNNANMLSLGARFVSIEEAKEVAKLWLETEFGGEERHVRRINKIDEEFEENDFDVWNRRKKKLHVQKKNLFFHEKEVWWCSLGMNIGYETTGKGDRYIRPVIILKKFSKDTALVVPLTTSGKENKYFFPLTVGKEGSKANLSQIRLVDTRRFVHKLDSIPDKQYRELQSALMSLHFQEK